MPWIFSFLAINTFFCYNDPKSMTKSPANIKRIPANIKTLGTPSMLNNLYPHLIKGAALPHNVQHNIASKNTCNGFLKNSLFCILKLYPSFFSSNSIHRLVSVSSSSSFCVLKSLNSFNFVKSF